jgi:hypothetical protein
MCCGNLPWEAVRLNGGTEHSISRGIHKPVISFPKYHPVLVLKPDVVGLKNNGSSYKSAGGP